jgi:hypothetical protein
MAPKHSRLLALALGVTTTAKWNKTLDANGIDLDLDDNEPSQLLHKKFELCVALFLEEVARQKYLSDSIIRWLRLGRFPMRMPPDVAFDRRSMLLALLKCGLLCSKLPKPNAYELAETIFMAFPATYQEKYTETQEEIGEDLDPIRAAFTKYFAADVINGTIKTLSDKKEKKRPADSSSDRSHKRVHRPDKYSSGQGRQGDRRNDSDGYKRCNRDHHLTSSTKDDEYSFAKNKVQITYDDNLFAFLNCMATTADVVGNASIASEECFQGEEEKPQYNYKGPKVMPHKTRNTGYNFNRQYNWYFAQ